MRKETKQYPSEYFREALPQVSLVALMFVFCYIARAIFGPLLPYIREEFFLNYEESTQLLMLIAIGYATSTLSSAISCSFFPPRIIVSVATALAGVMLICISKSYDMGYFSFFTFLLGAAAGHYFNAGLSVMRGLVQAKDWAKAIAVHELGPTVSFILAPFLASILLTIMSWRDILHGLGYICIAGAVLFFFRAKSGHAKPQMIQFRNVSLLLKSKQFWLAAWIFVMGVAGEFAPYSVLPLHLSKQFSMSSENASILLGVSRIFPAFVIMLGGILTDMLGATRLLKICLLVFAISMILLAFPIFPVAMIGMFLQPIVTALIFPPLFVFIAQIFPISEQPLIFACAVPLSSILGGGVIPNLLGFLADIINFNVGFILIACTAIATLVALYLIPSTAVVLHDKN